MHSFTVCVSEFFLTFREKEVGVLHSEFGMDYDSVIRSVIESEVKNAAVPYGVDQFRLQRSVLEKYFHRRLKNRLEGIKNTTSLCTSYVSKLVSCMDQPIKFCLSMCITVVVYALPLTVHYCVLLCTKV